MRSKIGRGSSIGDEVQIDAVGLHLAGVERLHAVVERAGETELEFVHAIAPHPKRVTRCRPPRKREAGRSYAS